MSEILYIKWEFINTRVISPSVNRLDCKQSLFFAKVRETNARDLGKSRAFVYSLYLHWRTFHRGQTLEHAQRRKFWSPARQFPAQNFEGKPLVPLQQPKIKTLMVICERKQK